MIQGFFAISQTAYHRLQKIVSRQMEASWNFYIFRESMTSEKNNMFCKIFRIDFPKITFRIIVVNFIGKFEKSLLKSFYKITLKAHPQGQAEHKLYHFSLTERLCASSRVFKLPLKILFSAFGFEKMLSSWIGHFKAQCNVETVLNSTHYFILLFFWSETFLYPWLKIYWFVSRAQICTQLDKFLCLKPGFVSEVVKWEINAKRNLLMSVPSIVMTGGDILGKSKWSKYSFLIIFESNNFFLFRRIVIIAYL